MQIDIECYKCHKLDKHDISTRDIVDEEGFYLHDCECGAELTIDMNFLLTEMKMEEAEQRLDYLRENG